MTTLLLLIMVASISNGVESAGCGQASYDVKYHLFPSDLPQTSKYLTRQDSGNGPTRLYAFSPPYAAASRNRTFLTVNKGKSWRMTTQVLPNINALSSDTLEALTVTNTPVAYKVAHGNELWRSDDNGLHWREILYLINGLNAHQFAVKTSQTEHSQLRLYLAAVQNVNTIYSTLSVELMEPSSKVQKTIALDQLFISHDGGKSWTIFKADVANKSPVGISSLTPRRMMVESTSGPIMSHDGGSTWLPVGEQDRLAATASVEGFPDSDQEIVDLHRNATETSIMRAGFKGSLEWRRLRVYQFLFDPNDDNVVYVVSNKGLFKSEDGATHWIRLSVGDQYVDYLDEVNSLAVVGQGVIVVGTSTGIYRSVDGGCHFSLTIR